MKINENKMKKKKKCLLDDGYRFGDHTMVPQVNAQGIHCLTNYKKDNTRWLSKDLMRARTVPS